MLGQKYLTAIQKHFRYLFDDFHFVSVLCEEARGGEYVLIVLESPRCKVKFHIDQGMPECYFGTHRSPDSRDSEGPDQWHLINPIVGFLGRKKPDQAVPWPDKKDEWNAEEILAAYAAQLHPFMEDLLAAFDENTPALWWRECLKDVEERVRQRKEKPAHGRH